MARPQGEVLEYLYITDNFGQVENLIDDMVAGGTCAPVTDFATFANRTVQTGTIGASTNDTYGSCEACLTAADGVPTASEWGLLCIALGVLTIVGISIRQRESELVLEA